MNMNGFISRSSSIGRHVMHIAFKVKYCRKIFEYESVRTLCEKIFRDVAQEMKIDVQEIGFDKDHVHIIVDIGLYSIVEVAKKLKGVSGYKLLRTFKWLKKRYFWGSGLWNPATYFDSVGNNASAVRKYVKNQGIQLRLTAFNLDATSL
jgi:putative transposase